MILCPDKRIRFRRRVSASRQAGHRAGALVQPRDTLVLDAFLELALGLPQRVVAAGEVLLAEGDVGSMLFILVDGALRVEKAGVPIASITEPGSCVGELSLLLDVPATADVVVSATATLAFVDDARRMLEEHPNLALVMARLLAARLQHMTTYLADLQNQYADHGDGLGMVDAVLGSLMHKPGTRSELGSERDPYPEY
jgi:CRP/FNR family transcriptional regulator, cyclic AMP receptor protein